MTTSCEKYLKLFSISEPASVFNEREINFITHTLERQEEMELDVKDQWGNFDAHMTKNEFHTPYLDLFVLKRMKELKLEQPSIWPNQADFSVCLSHDVDRVESYSPSSFLRNQKKQFQFADKTGLKIKLLLNIVKTALKKSLLTKKNDALWAYEKWLNIEKKYNAKSTYFFFVRPQKKSLSIHDCDYLLTDDMLFDGQKMTVKNYIQKLQENGDEIGLHGSYYSYNASALFGKQKKALEDLIGEPIRSTRQHYLHFDIKETPSTHLHEGIKTDSTLGFNTAIGFRAGTAFPFYLARDNGYLLEIPLLIMDSALYVDSKKSIDTGIEEILKIIDFVEEVKGCLTVNFHPDYFNNPTYFKTYEFLLKNLSKRNCTFMTMNEVQQTIEKICAE